MIKIGFYSGVVSKGHLGRGIGFYSQHLINELLKRSDIKIKFFSEISSLTDVDLVHYPSFDLFTKTLPFLKKYPTVVTIHDVTPLVFPKHYPPGIRGSINFNLQKLALSNVKAVITDSLSSKQDLQTYLSIPDEKIFPIYLAASKTYKKIKSKKRLKQVSELYKLPQKFALFVGNVNWNKNILNLAQACIEEDLDLCLVGKSFIERSNLNHPELKSFKNFLEKYEKNPLIHILGFLPDDDLAVVYNLADLLLFPSFYEGFGLPILEAQSCGIPVITSKVSSLPEVAGKGALFVDPYNSSDIRQAITMIQKNTKIRKDLIKKGNENCQKFSWKKTAEETLDVYKQVLQK